MTDNLLGQGLTLLLAGMGTVYLFLILLVAAMSLMSRIVMRLQERAVNPGATEEEVAAISAAINGHRNR